MNMVFQSEPGPRALRPAHRAASISLRQRRIWFADNEGDPEPETAPGKNGGTETGATFTQADLDRMVGTARQEARSKAVGDLLKELGFEKADDLKAIITAAKQREDADKTELEKAQARIAALEKGEAEAKAAVAKATQERLEERRNAAILTALKDARKPADLFILVQARMADDVAKTMSDTGELDAKQITTLVDKAKKEWADQFQSGGPGSPSNRDGKTPTPDPNKVLDGFPKVRL